MQQLQAPAPPSVQTRPKFTALLLTTTTSVNSLGNSSDKIQRFRMFVLQLYFAVSVTNVAYSQRDKVLLISKRSLPLWQQEQ